MKNFLEEVVLLKRREIEVIKARRPMTDFVDSKRLLKGVRPFKEAISAGGGVNLIAEIKKKSPSARKNFFRKLDVAGIARIYKENGARALSVLTDKKFFGGSVLHIGEAKKAVDLPVLRKDFIIDEYQVYEARYFGADAVLLIARILSVEQIKSFIHLAKRIGMSCVVEIHDENDLEKACLAGSEIMGINNRDLDTLRVSIDNTFRLAAKIPNNIIKISESGVNTSQDILNLRKIGMNAVLIGTAFLGARDMAGKVREITSLGS
ncbi:MAG: indole-3-glycerol phosphate synthase TrpC [Candidatus Omnitrophota bacterium]